MERVRGEVNCIGHAYYRLGLQDGDDYLWPNSIKEIAQDFKEANYDEAEAIIITIGEWDHNAFIHLAALDPTDRHYVIHRRGCGAKITRDPLETLFAEYHGNEFNFTLLKVKRK
jgi:hypothetical protein